MMDTIPLFDLDGTPWSHQVEPVAAHHQTTVRRKGSKVDEPITIEMWTWRCSCGTAGDPERARASHASSAVAMGRHHFSD